MPPPRNHLLASLPADELHAFLPRLTRVPLALGTVQMPVGQPVATAWFPETGFTSLIADLGQGVRAEVGLAGREGMVGLPLVLGSPFASHEGMVQHPGEALCIGAALFRQSLDELPALRAALLRYAAVVMAQVAQTAACNGRHALPQRLARWLLMAHDRVDGDCLPLTQEFLALMLCVHRPSVTVAARALQDMGLIRYSGGAITVLDRARLETAACGCHAAVNRFAEAAMARG